MTKMAEIIQLHTGYASAVGLQEALHNRLETLVKEKALDLNKLSSTYEFRQSADNP